MRGNGLIAAFLSAIIPGLGQGFLGRWKRAVLFVIPVGLGAIAGVVLVDMSTFDLIGLAVRPDVLRTVLIVNLGIVIWRIIAITDAFSVSGTPRTWWRIAIVAALAVAVTLPHVVVAQYTLDAAYVLDEVFVAAGDEPVVADILDDDIRVEPISMAALEEALDGDLLPALPDPTMETSRYEYDRIRPRMFQPGLGDPDAVEAALLYKASRDRTVADRVGTDAEGAERITILLAGGDGGAGRSGSRTDVINVVSIDTRTGKAAIFGIPRNMTHAPLPDRWSTAFVDLEKQLTPYAERRKWTDEDGDGEPDQFVPCHCFPDQINAIYPFTRKWTETYPDEREPGLAALRDVLEIMLGIDIDYYALVNMNGFVNVVNALGGVNVYVTRGVYIEMSDPKNEGEWIEVSVGRGWRRLNGLNALGYVRERRSSNDYVRMERQRCLLKAVAAKATPATIVSRFSRLSRAMVSSVKTEVRMDDRPPLLELTASLDLDDIATVGFVPPYYTPVLDHRGKPTPDLERIHAAVQFALASEAVYSFHTAEESECRV
jgi:LCP family protein required for cell wall assembly